MKKFVWRTNDTARRIRADDGDMTLAEAVAKMEQIEKRFAKYAVEG